MSYYLLLNWRNVRHHPDPFEYMSHYLSQTQKIDEDMRSGLNICRIAFYSNYNVIEVFSNEFEYMSYYLLLKLRVWAKGFISTFLNYSSSSKSVSNPGCSSVVCCFLSMYFSESDHWLSVTQSTRTLPWGGSPAWIYFNAERPPDWVGLYLA